MPPTTPVFIDSPTWAGILVILKSLWFFAFMWVTFALSMLFAHGIVPSLLTSGHIPARFQKVRPILYTVALIGFLGAIFFIGTVIANLTTIYGIYDRRVV